MIDGKLKLIIEHKRPYGIRDDSGFLLFFPQRTRYLDQLDRYKKEISDQNKLAEYLLKLKEAK